MTAWSLPCRAPAQANGAKVTLTANRTTVSPEDTVVLQAVVEGDGSKPEIANADGFEVQFVGSSSQVRIANGHMSSSKAYTFVLSPKSTGTFTVGPARIKTDDTDGRMIESGTVTITVAGAGGGAGSPSQGPGDRDAFLEVEVSNETPYVGEQVLYTVRFYARTQAQGVQMHPLEFDGFLNESLGDSKTYQRVIDGQAWQVSEIRWALYPVSSGRLSIPSPKVVAQFLLPSRSRLRSLFDDPFFSDFDSLFREPRQRTLVGDSVTLDVKPLPEEGKPADFSGLVGSYQIALEQKEQEIEAGQSATVTVTVKGDGDLRSLSSLKWPLPGGVKSYDDQPVLKTAPAKDGLIETKTFRKALVPLKEGDLSLPPVAISYFDPKAGEYRLLETNPIALKVRPSSRPETVPPAPETRANPVPSPLIDAAERLRPTPERLRRLSIGAGGAATAILLFFAVRALIRRRRLRIERDPGYKKRKKALKTALRSLEALPSSGRGLYEGASLVLRDFLGDKFGIDGRALTPADVRRRLAPSGASEKALEDAASFLRQCDEGLYGNSGLSEGRRDDLKNRLKEILFSF